MKLNRQQRRGTLESPINYSIGFKTLAGLMAGAYLTVTIFGGIALSSFVQDAILPHKVNTSMSVQELEDERKRNKGINKTNDGHVKTLRHQMLNK